MKPFLISAAMLLPLCVNAQTFRVSGGISTNTAPSFTNAPSNTNTAVSSAFALSYAHPIGKYLEIGPSVSLMGWRNKSTITITENGIDGYEQDVTYIFAKPSIGYGIFINGRLSFGASTIHAGIYGGGVHVSNDGAGTLTERHYNSGNGYSIGGQIGYGVAVAKRVSIGLEFSPRYSSVSTKPFFAIHPNIDYSVLAFPVMVTLGYKL